MNQEFLPQLILCLQCMFMVKALIQGIMGEQGRYQGESLNMGSGSYQGGSSQMPYSFQNKGSSNGSNIYVSGNNFTRPYSRN